MRTVGGRGGENDSKETAQGEKCLLSYLVTVMRTRTNYYNFAVLIFSTYIAIHFSSLAIYLCVHPRGTKALLQIEKPFDELSISPTRRIEAFL